MDIKQFCYKLYIEDWKLAHEITREREMRELGRYFEEFGNNEDYPYREYLDDYGYGGQYFVCFDEFLGAEYQDKEYILGLIKSATDDTGVIREYLRDIEEAA